MSKNYGTVKTYNCGRCNNISEWNLYRVSTWFTLYFIPVFPYSYKRYLVCPICGACLELTKEEFEDLKSGTPLEGAIKSSVSTTSGYSNEYGSPVRKTETQLNYLRQMEELKREKEQRMQDDSSLSQ
ncbi:MAG: zinc ribbon domain-containing protein [Clostridia bacterium]|nr:zinc ribbon domain-containing protein [Clostridia bacterium]